MAKPVNRFKMEAESRHNQQETIKAQIGIAPPKNNRKVPMNITLPSDYKERLTFAAKAKHISASVLIQRWIDEFC